jgi:hypothetical protein
MSRCNNKAPKSNIAIELQNNIIQNSKIAQNNVNTNLYINIQYHIIYNNSSQNISLERIRAQHDVINHDFNNTNYDSSKIPQSGEYNFNNVVGNPSITFLPSNSLDLNESNIIRKFTNRTSFSGINDVVVNGGSSAISNVLNVYICNLNNLLGEAYIQDNRCTVLYSSIGGGGNLESINYNTVGTIGNYNLGRTLTHEIGHNFGLYHIFMDIYSGDICSNSQLHPDIPKQSIANGTNAVLYKNSSGQWHGSGAYNSCSETDQFMNFMDYVTDKNMVMFSNDQSNIMNTFVATSGKFKLESNPNQISAPNPPYNVQVINSSITHNSLTLIWEHNDNNLVFIIESKKNEGNFIIIDRVTQKTITIDNLLPGTNYIFRISAENSNGIISSPSNETMVVKTISTNPDNINKPLYYSLTNNLVKLFWHIPDLKGSELLYYKIKINCNGDESFQYSDNNYYEYNINSQNTYFFNIKVYTKNNELEYSSLNWSPNSDLIDFNNINYRIYSNGIINKNIPEHNSLTSDTLIIEDSYSIDNLELNIHKLEHSWVGDIKLDINYLNQSLNLINSPGEGIWGSENDNFYDTIISDSGSISIEDIDDELPPHTGIYKPLNSLDIFKNLNSKGNFTITIEDLYPLEDNGTIQLWSLKINYNDTLPKWNSDINVNTVFTHNSISLNNITQPSSISTIKEYEIKYKKESDINYQHLKQTQFNFLINNLDSFTVYQFWVRCLNIIGYSDWYIVNYFYYDQKLNTFVKTLAYKPVWEQPLNINIINQNVYLSWTKPKENGSNILDYKLLLIDENNNTIFEIILDNQITSYEYKLDTFNLNYQYQITATNSIGSSTIDSHYFKLENVVPFWINSDINILINNGLNTKFNWSIPNNGGLEILEFTINIINNTVLNTYKSNNNELIINTLPNLEYEIEIYCSNQIGISESIYTKFTSPKINPFWETSPNININFNDIDNIIINWDTPNNGGRELSHLKMIINNNNEILINEPWSTQYLLNNFILDIDYKFKIDLYSGAIENQIIYWSLPQNQEFTLDSIIPFWNTDQIINITRNYNNLLEFSIVKPNSKTDITYNIQLLNQNNENNVLITDIITDNEDNYFQVDNLNTYTLILQSKNSVGFSKKITYENILIINKLPIFENLSYSINNITHNSIEFTWSTATLFGYNIANYIITINNQIYNTDTNNIIISDLYPSQDYSVYLKCETLSGESNNNYLFIFNTDNYNPEWDKFNMEYSFNQDLLDITWNKVINNIYNIEYQIEINVNNNTKLFYTVSENQLSINIDNFKNYVSYESDYIQIQILANNDYGSSEIQLSDKIYILKYIPFWNDLKLINNQYYFEWSIPNSPVKIDRYILMIDNKTFQISNNYLDNNQLTIDHEKEYNVNIISINKFGYSYKYNLVTKPNKILWEIDSINYDIISNDSINFYFNYQGGYNYKINIEYDDNTYTYENSNNIIISNLTSNKSYNFKIYFIIDEIQYTKIFDINDIIVHFFDQEIDYHINTITSSSINITISSNIYITETYIYLDNNWIKMMKINDNSYSCNNLLPLQTYNSKIKIITEFKDYIIESIEFQTLNSIPIWEDQNIYTEMNNNKVNIIFGNIYNQLNSTKILQIKYDSISHEYNVTNLTNFEYTFPYYNHKYVFIIIASNSFGKSVKKIDFITHGLSPYFINKHFTVKNTTLSFFDINIPEYFNGNLEVNIKLFYKKYKQSDYVEIINFIRINNILRIYQKIESDNYFFKLEIYNEYGNDILINPIHINNNILYWDSQFDIKYKNHNLFLTWNNPKSNISSYQITCNQNSQIFKVNTDKKFIEINNFNVNHQEYMFDIKGFNLENKEICHNSKSLKIKPDKDIIISGNIDIEGNISF